LLVVFAREGRGAARVVRDKWDVWAIWMVGALCWAVFFVLAVRAGSAYQVAVLSGVTLDMLPKLAIGLITSGAYRMFYDSWLSLAHIIRYDLSSLFYVQICLLVLIGALLWLSRGTVSTETNKAKALRTIIAGLVAAALGYAPILASYSLLLVNQRTFLAPAMGGALVVFGLIEYASAAINPRVIALLCGVLLGACLVGQLYQFDQYNRTYASAYRPLLLALAPFINRSSGAYSVIRNDYGYLSGVYDLGLETSVALGYLLPNIDISKIFVCEGRSSRVLPRWRGEPERTYCKIDGSSVAIIKNGATVKLLDRAAIGILDVSGDISADEIIELKHAPLPHRVTKLLSAAKWTPENSLFRRAEHADQYECRFPYMWGYAIPCRTFGFYEPEPQIEQRGASYAWIGEPDSGLIIDIAPSQTTYALNIEIVTAHSHSMHASLNGNVLSARWRDATHFEAVFSANLLRPTNNVLELKTELDQNYGLSIAIKSVSIVPIK
jgi:hypothetical protein